MVKQKKSTQRLSERAKKRRRRRRAATGVVVALLLLVLLYILLIGRLLVRDEEPVQADAIVVLLGKTPERILQGVELYEEGFADIILMAETRVEHVEELDIAGVDVPLGTEAEREIAVQLGVPAEDVVIIPASTESTQDEAVAIRDYLQDNTAIDSILLVTSKSHSYRASMIFGRAFEALDRDIELTSVPSVLDEFSETRWFRDREQIQEVFSETFKLLSFWLIDYWAL